MLPLYDPEVSLVLHSNMIRMDLSHLVQIYLGQDLGGWQAMNEFELLPQVLKELSGLQMSKHVSVASPAGGEDILHPLPRPLCQGGSSDLVLCLVWKSTH